MHIVVHCNGPALATVEVNKTTLPENQDGRGAEGDRFVPWDFGNRTERTPKPAIQQQTATGRRKDILHGKGRGICHQFPIGHSNAGNPIQFCFTAE